jgi:hypothetical protein
MPWRLDDMFLRFEIDQDMIHYKSFRLFWLLTFLAMSLFPTPSLASVPGEASQVTGVWRGTLGKRAIMACWDQFSGASYYFLRKPALIALA